MLRFFIVNGLNAASAIAFLELMEIPCGKLLGVTLLETLPTNFLKTCPLKNCLYYALCRDRLGMCLWLQEELLEYAKIIER